MSVLVRINPGLSHHVGIFTISCSSREAPHIKTDFNQKRARVIDCACATFLGFRDVYVCCLLLLLMCVPITFYCSVYWCWCDGYKNVRALRTFALTVFNELTENIASHEAAI